MKKGISEVFDETRIDGHYLKFKFSSYFTIKVTRFYTFFLLPCFLALCKSNTKLYQIPFAIYLHRDEGRSHFFHFDFESLYFTFFEKECSLTFWLEYTDPSLIVSYVYSSGVGISFLYEYVWSFEVDASVSDTFHFFAIELDTCLILFDDLVVEVCFFILCEDDFCFFLGVHAEIIDKCRKMQLAFP